MAYERSRQNRLFAYNLAMIFKATVTKIKIAYQDRYEPEYIHVLATFYWRLLLVGAAIVLVGELVYCAQQFFNIQSDLAQQATTQTQLPPNVGGTDKARLAALLDNLAHKQSQYDLLKSGTSTYADPSR